eukprot:3738890-Amphidinium_carterae.2
MSAVSRFDIILQALKDEHVQEISKLKGHISKQQQGQVVEFGHVPSLTRAMSGEMSHRESILGQRSLHVRADGPSKTFDTYPIVVQLKQF